MTETKRQKIGWFEGEWKDYENLKIPINDRGLNFADGIFETVLILNGKPQLLGAHLKRWENSAKILGMQSPPSQEWLVKLIDEGINKSKLTNENGVIRLNWSRGQSHQRGIDINDTKDHRFWIEISYYQPTFNAISTFISNTERRNTASKLSSCKTFAYNQAVQARLEAKKAGYDDALLLNNEGNICCGPTANILVKRNNVWLTPPVNSGCLPGIMRQQGINFGIIKEAIIEETLEEKDECFLINSLSCHPINSINRQKLTMSTKPKEFWLNLLTKK